jgi:hypothetical protein
MPYRKRHFMLKTFAALCVVLGFAIGYLAASLRSLG